MQESVNCTGCIFQAICVKFLKDNHATLAPVSQVENVFIQSRLTWIVAAQSQSERQDNQGKEA